MMNEATYAEANRTYWTHRAPSYGDVNRKELATAQRRIWTQTLDVRIQARFPDRARSSIRVLDVGTGPGILCGHSQCVGVCGDRRRLHRCNAQ